MAVTHLKADNIVWGIDGNSILKNISIDAKKGETIGIVGPNGAGKTSLLKCLYQENKAEKGEVTLSQMPLSMYDRREVAQRIAVVGQHHDAVFDLTVVDIVNMGLIPHKTYFQFNNDADRANVERAIAQVDLSEKSQQIFNTLSGGEQQRCLIARAIVQQPEVLIMDEPTNHLDVFYQHQVLSIVKNLGLTLIMTIHDLNLAAQYCDRILLMDKGEVLAFDTPEQVLTSKLLKQVFHLDCLIDEHPLTGKLRVSFAGIQS